MIAYEQIVCQRIINKPPPVCEIWPEFRSIIWRRTFCRHVDESNGTRAKQSRKPNERIVRTGISCGGPMPDAAENEMDYRQVEGGLERDHGPPEVDALTDTENVNCSSREAKCAVSSVSRLRFVSLRPLFVSKTCFRLPLRPRSARFPLPSLARN